MSTRVASAGRPSAAVRAMLFAFGLALGFVLGAVFGAALDASSNGRLTPIQGTTSRSVGNVEEGAHGRLGAVTAYPFGLATEGDRACLASIAGDALGLYPGEVRSIRTRGPVSAEHEKTPACGPRPTELRSEHNAHFGVAVARVQPRHFLAGWSSQVARQVHTLEVARSNRAPASVERSARQYDAQAASIRGNGCSTKPGEHGRNQRGQDPHLSATTRPAIGAGGTVDRVSALGSLAATVTGALRTSALVDSNRGLAARHGKHLTRQTYFGERAT